MSDKKYQIKATEEEIECVFNALCRQHSDTVTNFEEHFDRISYFGKRLVAIKKGEPEITQEPSTSSGEWK